MGRERRILTIEEKLFIIIDWIIFFIIHSYLLIELYISSQGYGIIGNSLH